jgi:hypothetical protein
MINSTLKNKSMINSTLKNAHLLYKRNTIKVGGMLTIVVRII